MGRQAPRAEEEEEEVQFQGGGAVRCLIIIVVVVAAAPPVRLLPGEQDGQQADDPGDELLLHAEQGESPQLGGTFPLEQQLRLYYCLWRRLLAEEEGER